MCFLLQHNTFFLQSLNVHTYKTEKYVGLLSYKMNLKCDRMKKVIVPQP